MIFIGVTYVKFLSVDKGQDTVINMGDLNISFCKDTTCDTTYTNIGQIIGTKVYNYTTTDKIYLLTPQEIYSNWSNQNDKTIKTSRQLDYYKGKGTTTNATSAIKSYMGTNTYYWLRSAYEGWGPSIFYYITSDGKDYGGDIIQGVESLGISPVFRIG